MSTKTRRSNRYYPEPFKKEVVTFIDKRMADGDTRGSAITQAVRKFGLPNREGARQWWLKAHGANARSAGGQMKVPSHLKAKTGRPAAYEANQIDVPVVAIETPKPTPLAELIETWDALGENIAEEEQVILNMKARRDDIKAEIIKRIDAG